MSQCLTFLWEWDQSTASETTELYWVQNKDIWGVILGQEPHSA
jgi:hypothetical protein